MDVLALILAGADVWRVDAAHVKTRKGGNGDGGGLGGRGGGNGDGCGCGDGFGGGTGFGDANGYGFEDGGGYGFGFAKGSCGDAYPFEERSTLALFEEGPNIPALFREGFRWTF